MGFVLKSLNKLEEARSEFRRSVELAPAGSEMRAKSLFHLAQVRDALNDRVGLEEDLKQALASEAAGSIFSTAERVEINRMLKAAGKGE